MRDNPLQFAVVREDPAIEAAVIDRMQVERALLVASGGCTALSLACLRPEVALTIFDVNPHQLAHCETKRAALSEGLLHAFNVGSTDPRGYNECGNFEALFRGLRGFLMDFAGDDHLKGACEGDAASRERLFASRYWSVAFDLFFADPLLLAMFGPAAVQHAPPGSYPRYFQRAFERGLARADARDNYFLHHALLGRYHPEREQAWPAYLRAAPITLPRLDAVEGTLERVPELGRYQLVSLSNLFDWMDEAEMRRTLATLAEGLAPGATVVLRQLNSALDLAPLLSPSFELETALAAELLEQDRSLFYARLWIARAK